MTSSSDLLHLLLSFVDDMFNRFHLASLTHFMNVSVEEDGSIYCVPVVKTKLNTSFSVVADGSTTEKPRCILSLSVLSSQTFGDWYHVILQTLEDARCSCS